MRRQSSIALIALAFTAPAAFAQAVSQEQALPPSFTQIGMLIYPAEGQSAEQQEKDEAACWEWAEAQTGINLVAGGPDTGAAGAAAADQTARATEGAAVAGAARGAIAGVAIGAIAGDAGTGAAIGAAAGAMGGRRARRQAIASAEQQGAAAAEAEATDAVDSFKRAGGVCLQGRGYTVG